MRFGIFSVIFQDLSFEQAMDKAASMGFTTVELGTGSYPGNHHCSLDELLESETKRKDF
jgi:sugar phosphate isomerase/epimerase